MFVRLMQEYRLRELFKPSMAELGLCIYQFEHLLQVRKSSLLYRIQTNTNVHIMFDHGVCCVVFTKKKIAAVKRKKSLMLNYYCNHSYYN